MVQVPPGRQVEVVLATTPLTEPTAGGAKVGIGAATGLATAGLALARGFGPGLVVLPAAGVSELSA
jgi:hypothetical protein